MAETTPSYADHSVKGYLKRLGGAFVRGQLGSLLQFEKNHKLTKCEEEQKQLYIEVLEELGESTQLDLEHTPYFPYIRQKNSIKSCCHRRNFDV